jgi:hypothetical protein
LQYYFAIVYLHPRDVSRLQVILTLSAPRDRPDPNRTSNLAPDIYSLHDRPSFSLLYLASTPETYSSDHQSPDHPRVQSHVPFVSYDESMGPMRSLTWWCQRDSAGVRKQYQARDSACLRWNGTEFNTHKPHLRGEILTGFSHHLLLRTSVDISSSTPTQPTCSISNADVQSMRPPIRGSLSSCSRYLLL